MKIINKIARTGFVILMMVSSSCNEDFLDKNPLDQVSSEAFWNNEADVDMALAGCYSRLLGSFHSYLRGYFEGLSDVGLAYWGFYGFEDNYNMSNISASTGGGKDDMYNTCYRGIAQCNFFIDNVDQATSVDQSYITQAKAEARFLRALFYFDLTQCFGDVPLYKETPEDAEASKIAKSSKADVLAFIHEDLDFAISTLPDEPYFEGHAVKGSAMGLKVRVLITEEKWSETAALAQQIMSSGIFELYDDYEGMFINRGQGADNKEIMFSCEYLTPDIYHSVYGMNIEFAKHIFLRPGLRDAFECIDGLPISESPLYDSTGLGASMVNDFTVPWNFRNNRDPRFEYIIRSPDEQWEGHYVYEFYNVTGVQNRKYIDPTIPGGYGGNFQNDWDYILIRYADILLMYAEAKNELSGPDQSVYAAIDAVRGRPSVDMPPVDQARYNTKELVREYIRHERLVEFPMEGIRYFDLKRWRTAEIVMPSLTNLAGIPYVFDQSDYLWPFSQNELDANPNLVQTQGY